MPSTQAAVTDLRSDQAIHCVDDFDPRAWAQVDNTDTFSNYEATRLKVLDSGYQQEAEPEAGLASLKAVLQSLFPCRSKNRRLQIRRA